MRLRSALLALCYVAWLLPLVLLSTSPCLGQGGEQSDSFKLYLDSHVDLAMEGKTQPIEAKTGVWYTWKSEGSKRTLILDSVEVKVTVDGNEVMNQTSSRDKLVQVAGGVTTETKYADAASEVKSMLKDTFGTPLCIREVDKNGKEVKREIVAAPGAKATIDNGMVANAIFFHDSYFGDLPKWESQTEISMGNGGYVGGKLTLAKDASAPQVFKVTGTLTNDKFPLPGQPVTLVGSKYVVTGEQTYDPARGNWAKGKRKIDITADMEIGGSKFADMKGVMKVDFERLEAKK